MTTNTDTPTIVVASLDRRDNQSYLRARTNEGVELLFKLEPTALAIIGLTLDGVLREERDHMLRTMGEGPKPPAAPDSTEGLEG